MGDRHEVLNLWESVWSAEYTGRRVAISRAAFKRFFEKAPDAKAAFSRISADDLESAEFTAHCIRVTNGIDTIINLAFDPPSLEEQLHHLAHQHASYEGIKVEHFKALREAFAEILPQAVPCFNTAAWLRCMTEMQDWISEELPHL